MLSGLLIASQFLLVSDRASLWDPDKLSTQTIIMQEPTEKKIPLIKWNMKGKKVLLLVHGFNNNAQEALSTYRLIDTNLSTFMNERRSSSYDYVIGYLWPGYHEAWEYFEAKQNVAKLAIKLRSHLEALADSGAKVDVLAHSMGNFLVLEALNYPSPQNKKLVNNYYSLAAAVDDETLEKGQKYYNSTQNCEKLFVFYSNGDEVLKWSYRIAEWDKALGSIGAEHPDKLSQNVQLINYTKFIGAHSQYFTYLPIYAFIGNDFLTRP
jgi:esterase/lipase superfamily enzyme